MFDYRVMFVLWQGPFGLRAMRQGTHPQRQRTIIHAQEHAGCAQVQCGAGAVVHARHGHVHVFLYGPLAQNLGYKHTGGVCLCVCVCLRTHACVCVRVHAGVCVHAGLRLRDCMRGIKAKHIAYTIIAHGWLRIQRAPKRLRPRTCAHPHASTHTHAPIHQTNIYTHAHSSTSTHRAHTRYAQVAAQFNLKQKIFTHELSRNATRHTLIAGMW